MKKYKIWLLLFFPLYAVINIGWMASLNPIYNYDDIIYDPALIGTWEIGGWFMPDTCEVAPYDETGKAYLITCFNGSDNVGEFEAHLVKVGDYMFLDAFPYPKYTDEYDMAQDLAVYTHFYILVDQIEPDIIVRIMDETWLRNWLQENPESLKHDILYAQDVEPGQRYFSGPLLLTASTEDLQAFMVEHIDTEGAYSDQIVCQRVDETSAPVEEEIPPG